MNRRIFREYDIRGVADRDLDDATARAIGRAIAAKVKGGDVAVGRDCRLSSPRLFDALVGGLHAGVGVIDLGVVPSPVAYFAAHELAPAATVVITGSHNPAEDNGFKILVGRDAIYGEAIQEIARAAEAFANVAAAPTRGVRAHDIVPAYLDRVVHELRLGPRRFKIVVDAGNGAGGPTAVALYQRLGFDVVPLYCELDGRFPHHHPDPTMPENLADLRAAVVREGAEVGLALDGDADRLGAVDGSGRILWGDQLMILLGKALLAEVPNARLVGEVKCSQVMYDELAAAGARVEMWKVGHSLIKARMKEIGAALAGEMSGHLFFAHRWLGFDDAIYAGARLLELLTRGTRSLAELAAELPVAINTPELRIDCPDELKQGVVREATARLRNDPGVRGIVDIDGVRARFDGGWGLVRASNTQPALVMRCEATTVERLAEIRAAMEAHVAAARRAIEAT